MVKRSDIVNDQLVFFMNNVCTHDRMGWRCDVIKVVELASDMYHLGLQHKGYIRRGVDVSNESPKGGCTQTGGCKKGRSKIIEPENRDYVAYLDLLNVLSGALDVYA